MIFFRFLSFFVNTLGSQWHQACNILCKNIKVLILGLVQYEKCLFFRQVVNMYSKLLLCSIFVLLSFSTYAEPKRLNIDNILKNDLNEPKESSTSFILRYQNIGVKIQHNETSSTPEFTSLEQDSDINISNISVEASQEFFCESYLSISTGVRVSVNKGYDKGSNDSSNLSYKDKVSGKSYGAGLSLNLNTQGYGLKIQFFVSSYYIVNKNDFNLSYNNISSSADPFNINYTVDSNTL